MCQAFVLTVLIQVLFILWPSYNICFSSWRPLCYREPGVSKCLKTHMEAEAEQGELIGVTWCAVNLLNIFPHAPA